MNHFSKVTLNFLVCWSLLFTQAALSVEDAPASPEAGSYFSDISAGVINWFSERIYGDADTTTVENNATGTSTSRNRRGARYNFSTAPVGLGIDPALGRISNSCSSVNTLELSIPGIESLADHFSDSSCSSEAFQSLATVGSENGEANSVNLCKNLEVLKDSGACASSPMSAVALPLEIKEWRNDPEMRELEVELKAKTLEKELEDLNKIVELQATLASDMELMNYFYKSLQSETDPQKRETYKAQYGLEDSFFNRGSDMPLSQFVNKVFSCLPGSQGLQKIDLKTNSCEGADSLLPGEDTGTSVLDEARTRFASNCIANEACSLSGSLGGPEDTDFARALSSSVGDSIANNAGEGQSHMGNIAAIDSNLGMNHLPEAIKMMDFFNNDTSDGSGNPKVFGIVGRALDEHNRRSRHHGEDSLQLARQTALNYTLNLIREESDFLEDEAGLAYFNGIIESSTQNDLLNFEGYEVGQVLPLIENYQAENPELGSLYPEGFTEEQKQEKNLALVALIQRAAVGQRMGDYIVENRRGLRAQAMVLGGTQNSDRISAISTSLTNTLNGGRAGTISSQEVGSVLSNLTGQQKLGVLWESAAKFESIFSSYGSPLNMAHGARNLAKVLEMTNENLSREEILKSYPELANMGHAAFTERRMKLVKNQAFALVAQRSAMACNKKIKPAYMKHKLCSPLSEPEYSNKALEKLLGTAGPNRQAGDILNSASILCTSILNEDFDRRVEAQNYDTLSPNIGQIRQQRCNEKSNNLFCGDTCTEDQVRGVTNSQVLLFGFVCQPGHQTVENSQVMASIDSNGVASFPEFAGIGNIEDTSAKEVMAIDNVKAPVTTAGSFDSGLRATTSQRNINSKFPSKRRLVTGNGGNGISSSQNITSVIPSSKVINSFETSKGEAAGGFSNSSSTVFPSQIRANTGEKESLAQELQGQESTLDPASQALLKRLEEMERRQADLQKELEESRKSLGEEEDEGKANLLAELNKLKSEIPLLEEKLREKQDVRRALAEAKPEVRSTAPVATPVRRSAFGGGSNVSRSIASVTPTSTGPSSAPVDNSSDDAGGSSSSGGVRNFSRGGGPEISSLVTSGSGRGEGLFTTDSVITLTQDIRDRAVIVAPGVSPEDAVLLARGPILIPLGEEGEFIMYEPELTVDGEVKTEDGQVVFKTVVKVSDLLARDRSARLPASIEEAPIDELPEGYDPRRLFQLDGLLNNVVPVSN